jgi:hypothetical protein
MWSICFSSYSIKSGSPSGGTLSGPGVSSNFAMSGSSYGGTIGGGNGTASATGPANWQFEWLGDEELPYQVVVRTTVTIQAESWQFGGSQGTVSVSGPSGLATTTTSYPIMGPGVPIGWYTKKVITGTIHTVVDGSAVISVNVPMSASATSSTGSMSAQAWSTVSLHPAVIDFGDSVANDDGVPLAPIGGKVIAVASVAGLSNQSSTFAWLTPGKMPFDSYTVASNFSSSSLTPWANSEGASESFYFREDGEVSLICQVTLPDIGISAIAKKTLMIEKPESANTENSIGAFQLLQNQATYGENNNVVYRDLFQLMQGGAYGRGLGFGIKEPDSVVMKNNGISEVSIVQLVKPFFYSVQEVLPGVDHHDYGTNNSLWGLDHNYPYILGSAKKNSLAETVKLLDSPGNKEPAFTFNPFKLIQVNSSFEAFLMFTPDWPTGSMPVTLTKNEWNCHGKAERTNIQLPFTITVNTANKGSVSSSTEHPIWTLRHISGN